MSHQETEESMSVDAHLDNIPLLRNFVEHCCNRSGIQEDISFYFKLAVDEICTNVITHGLKDGQAGTISLTFYHSPQQVKITITDNGMPFDPKDAPEPDFDAVWEERKIGGLGLYMIKQTMDEVIYETDEKSFNHLTLVKYLP